MKKLIRTLARSPGVSLGILLPMAVAVGGATAIFAMVRAVLLSALPYPEPNRIVTVWENSREAPRTQVSPLDLEDIGRRCRSLTALASYRDWVTTMSGRGPAEQLHGARVSAELFQVLGIHPFLGRGFLPHEFSRAQPVAIISNRLWRERFNAEASIVNQQIKLDGTLYAIVGVMPPGFDFPPRSSPTEVWAPLLLTVADANNRGNRDLQVVGRLRDKYSLTAARSEISAVARQLARDHPDTNSNIGFTINLLQSELRSPYQTGLLALSGASILIVLISCANNSGLLLARAISQQRSMVIRKALGASELRIIRDGLRESVFLSLLGAALGVFLAFFCLSAVRTFIRPPLSSQFVGIDLTVVAFAVGIAISSALLFGAVPALQASRFEELSSALRGYVGPSGATARRVQTALVVAETALALVLLVAAGLLIRTMVGIRSVPIGFNPDRVLTMNVFLPMGTYPTAKEQRRFFRDLLENLRRLPGVEDAALGSPLPWQGEIGVDFRRFDGPNTDEQFQAKLVICSVRFFRVLGVPLLRGREFAETDDDARRPVAIINEAMAKRYWKNQDPLGRVIEIEDAGQKEIVGVTADFRQSDFTEPPQPTIFIPDFQSPTPYQGVILRTSVDPRSLGNALPFAIGNVDPDIAPAGIHTMKEMLADSVAQQSFVTALLSAFAVIALALSIAGTYGFTARLVALRRREIAVRIAVGASPGRVLCTVLGKGFVLTAIGCAIGISTAMALTRILSSLIWGIKPTDPPTFIAALIVLVSVNLLALYRPAREAMRISPLELLREQ